jgi:hypothetical protein
MQPEILPTASFTAGAAGMGIGAWAGNNWLSILSGVAVLVTIWMQIRRDRREARAAERAESDD